MGNSGFAQRISSAQGQFRTLPSPTEPGAGKSVVLRNTWASRPSSLRRLEALELAGQRGVRRGELRGALGAAGREDLERGAHELVGVGRAVVGGPGFDARLGFRDGLVRAGAREAGAGDAGEGAAGAQSSADDSKSSVTRCTRRRARPAPARVTVPCPRRERIPALDGLATATPASAGARGPATATYSSCPSTRIRERTELSASRGSRCGRPRAWERAC